MQPSEVSAEHNGIVFFLQSHQYWEKEEEMGRKLDILLGRASKNLPKLKTLLGLTITRAAVLRSHRQPRCDHAHADASRLLQLGHVDRALLRVEQVIREQAMLDVFSMVEHYCLLLTDRFPLLVDHKRCPDELREAVSSLIFAASRCAELPELDKARDIFASLYGKDFVAASVELRENCTVNVKMIQKLSSGQPSLEARERVTREIALAKGISLEFCESINNTTEKLEQFESDGKSLSQMTHPKYSDVATAAQAAFESASLAALAARAAVELSRSESQEKRSNDGSKLSGRRNEVSGPNKVVVIGNSSNSSGADSEERVPEIKHNLLRNKKLGGKLIERQTRSSSSSSDSGDEDGAGSSQQKYRAASRGKNNLFGADEIKPSHGSHGRGSQSDASLGDDDSPCKHGTWCWFPPSSEKITDQSQGGSGEEGSAPESASTGRSGNVELESATSKRPSQSNSGEKVMSVRTRR